MPTFTTRMFLQTMESVLENDPDTIDLRKGAHGSYHYTFFVPSDEAFKSISSSNLRRLQSDQSYMTKVVQTFAKEGALLYFVVISI